MTRQLPDGSAGSTAPDPDGAPSAAGVPVRPPLPGAAPADVPRPRPAAHRAGAHRAPPSPARRAALVALLLLVVGGGAALLLVRPWAAASDDGTDRRDPALAAARWVEEQVPEDTPVSAPEGARSALEGAGLVDRLARDDAAGALQVVQGEPPAGATVLARFESDGTVLSVVDPAPGRPTAEELDQREDLAAAVLANPVAGATGRAADVLRAADVDARLLGLLAGLVSRMDVHVADFPPAPGEPDDGPPARWLLVDRAGGERLTPGAPATEEVVAYVEAQRPPFAPDTVETTAEGVLVGFDYVSAPDAVVTAGAS